MAKTSATTNTARGRCFSTSQANRVTTTGVRLHSTVALATEVMTMP